jgi:hypothetical protein
MERGDHLQTNSWGQRTFKPVKNPYSSSSADEWISSADEWRAVQRDLIKRGKVKEAIQMDIDDIRAKFGRKYEKGIQEMLNYVTTLPISQF